MPRVETIDEVRAVAAHRAARKQAELAPPSPLGVPALPGLGYVALTAQAIAGTIEWVFVAPTYVDSQPGEVWALVLDQAAVTEVHRRHSEMNASQERAGLPKLSTYSAETPYLIVRTA